METEEAEEEAEDEVVAEGDEDQNKRIKVRFLAISWALCPKTLRCT